MKTPKRTVRKVKTVEVGDRVWLTIPHNGTVSHVYGNGVRVDLDEIHAGTCMGRFGFDEVVVIDPLPKVGRGKKINRFAK